MTTRASRFEVKCLHKVLKILTITSLVTAVALGHVINYKDEVFQSKL